MLILKNAFRRHFVAVSISLTALMSLTGCYFEAESTDLKKYAAENPEHAHDPQIQMLLNDFKGLSSETLKTNAIPWKLAVTAVVTKLHNEQGFAIEKQTFNNILKDYGFIIPDKIENLKEGVPQPKFEYPIGLIRGDLEINMGIKIKGEIGNITCSVCHASRTYDSKGLPTNNVWLGAPNTSINLQAYTTQIYESLKYIRDHQNDFYQNLTKIYPDIDSRELKSMKHYLFAETARQIGVMEQGSDTVLAFRNGPPGGANAIGSFKRVFGIYKPGDFNNEDRGSVNIPDLGYRAFRRNMTVDGIYTLPGEKALSPLREDEATLARAKELGTIAAVFPIPVMGLSAKSTEINIEAMKESFGNFIFEYQSPKFPGQINVDLAKVGEVVYRESCMKCHGEYTSGIENVRLISYPNVLMAVEKIGTDPARLDSINDQLVKKMKKTWIPQKLQMDIRRGYMAPILSNIWSTAPYLHNGSVPTLWALMNPAERPEKFYTGGHALDFEKLGIAYPEGFKPTSIPVLVDTTEKGLSNKGHEKQFSNLSIADKKSLIEYLKLL